MNTATNSTGGFLGVLTLIFITLRLTNYIDWSWWAILSPLWVPGVLVFAVLLAFGVRK